MLCAFVCLGFFPFSKNRKKIKEGKAIATGDNQIGLVGVVSGSGSLSMWSGFDSGSCI